MSNQELADVDKTYNIYTVEQLQAMFPRVDLEALFALTGLTQTNHIQVMDLESSRRGRRSLMREKPRMDWRF